MYEFPIEVKKIIEKVLAVETKRLGGEPEFSMTDGLIANFSKPEYVRGMSQALYCLRIITKKERNLLRDESVKCAKCPEN